MAEFAEVTFSRVLIDSLNAGSDDAHMVSVVFFDIRTQENELIHDDFSYVKQIVGGGLESDPIEIVTPNRPPFNADSLHNEVERYFRECVGSQGEGINFEPGHGARMYDCNVVFSKMIRLEVI